MEAPTTYEQAAELLGEASQEGLRLRVRGGGTKLGWGAVTTPPDLEVSTGKLDGLVEHNAGDLTAVVQAGLPLARAQQVFGEAGQRAALDPPLGTAEAATVGGVVATGDSGPLRHRYGAPRDQVLGVTVALSDGTLARAGGKVIKNVAGYDLGKLLTGSFGTLGLIVQVALRLHPRPERTVTLVGRSGDPESLAAGAAILAHRPLELESLDVAWHEGSGAVLARFGGTVPGERAEAGRELLGELETELVEDDEDLWAGQRLGQRSAEGAVVRISGLPTRLDRVLQTAERLGGSVVGRAGLGLSWVRLQPGDLIGKIEELRKELAPFPCVVLDAPAEVREKLDPWGVEEQPAVELMRRVKARFDPAGVLNPGVFVGGI